MKYVLYLVDELRNTWKNIRDEYMRCKTNRGKVTRSGYKAARLPTCTFYSELEFLSDHGEYTSTSATNVLDKTNK